MQELYMFFAFFLKRMKKTWASFWFCAHLFVPLHRFFQH